MSSLGGKPVFRLPHGGGICHSDPSQGRADEPATGELLMKRIGMVCLVAAGWAAAAAESVTVDGVAAYVNDTVITVSEVREAMDPLVAQIKEDYQGAELSQKLQETYGDVLQDLIDNKLIVKAYEADEKIDKEAMDKHVERRVNEFIGERFEGDRQEFLKALKAERMTMDEWRRRMRERIIVGMMRRKEVDSQVVIPPREIRRVYEDGIAKYRKPERVKLRVIVIHGGTNEMDRASRSKLAADTLAKLKAGDSFADAARRLSDDAKGATGGDWGWVDYGDLRHELAGAVKKLEPGGLSPVTAMDGDLYLVKLEERQVAGVTPFEEVRGDIEKDLKRKEARRLYKVWVDRLRKDAYIETVKIKDA